MSSQFRSCSSPAQPLTVKHTWAQHLTSSGTKRENDFEPQAFSIIICLSRERPASRRNNHSFPPLRLPTPVPGLALPSRVLAHPPIIQPAPVSPCLTPSQRSSPPTLWWQSKKAPRYQILHITCVYRYVTKPIWDKLSRAVTKTSGFTLAQVTSTFWPLLLARLNRI